MTDLEFMDHAEQLLLAVERSCDRINDTSDADVDSQRSGGMVTLTFPNRSQIVINLQKPLHEVWMAPDRVATTTVLMAATGRTPRG